MVTAPRAPRQAMHRDNADAVRGGGCYRTVIFPLTQDPPEAGGTCFEEDRDGRCAHLVNRRGSSLDFDGSVPHYGAANDHASHTRIFLFAVVSSEECDANNDDPDL